jgi:Protein of unknown function (DUF3048) N-terminal domain/Protein of unknown function (DUF3048) C-terminal domain
MQRVALAVCTVAVIVGLAGLVAIAVGAHQPVPEQVTIPGAFSAVSGSDALPTAPPSGSAPLTGLPVADPAVLARPVVAVTIDNAVQARPQTGLDRADIVFESLVEGGLTRFVALFHSMDPGTVGPLRSARDIDADLLSAFSSVLGISGAAPGTDARLREAGLHVLSESGALPGMFFRTRERKSPHNLFARPLALWRAETSLPPAAPPWPFGRPLPLSARPALGARVVFSLNASATWTWDARRRTWLRQEDGRVHLTSSGGQVAAKNVVVARFATAPGGGVDAHGKPTVGIQVLGEGPAVVLRDGLAYDVRWRKTSPYSQFEWVTPGGAPLPLAPGQTWIELVPASGSLVVGQLP